MHSFWRAEPGRRFMGQYERRHARRASRLRRALGLCGGVLLIVVGVIFLPLPGPGFVPLLLGAALIAGESQRMATWLDSVEVRVRGWLGRKPA